MSINERFLALQAIRSSKQKDVANLQAKIKQERKQLKQHETAKIILQEVGIKTQEQLQFHLEGITSLAMSSIFPNPYNLKVNFVKRRDKSECDLTFERDGNEVNPIDASGGGAVDVAAFALRIASWSMQRPRISNTIILDEPMKNVSHDFRELTSEMIKKVSEKLGIQFIIITHDNTLTTFADRVFNVKIKNKITTVTTVTN